VKNIFRMPALTADNRKILKITAAAMLIAAALFVFAVKGESQTVELKDAGAEKSSSSEQAAPKGYIFVDIDGEVNSPGVYKVKAGSRIFEVIEKAGGLKDKADTSGINQAGEVKDGDKIIIPRKGQSGTGSSGAGSDGSSGTGTGESGGTSYSGSTGASGSTASGDITFVNINSADSTDLQKIPGVGPATAEKIIAYRQKNGYFRRKEDIKNVSGIGDKTYEKMKDLITV
jgi:competence protein ComEA